MCDKMKQDSTVKTKYQDINVKNIISKSNKHEISTKFTECLPEN